MAESLPLSGTPIDDNFCLPSSPVFIFFNELHQKIQYTKINARKLRYWNRRDKPSFKLRQEAALQPNRLFRIVAANKKTEGIQ